MSPKHLDTKAASYWGVVASSPDWRVIVTARSASYAVQFRSDHLWSTDRTFPTAGFLRGYVEGVLVDFPPVLLPALQGLPSDPRNWSPPPPPPRSDGRSSPASRRAARSARSARTAP